jgi:hypothetical protein
MARSQDAMRKRAEKRNRTLPEQRKADSNDMSKRLEQEVAVKKQRMMDTARSNTEPRGHYGPASGATHSSKQELAAAAAAATSVKVEAVDQKPKEAVPIVKKEDSKTAADTKTETRPSTSAINNSSNTSSSNSNIIQRSDPLAEQGSWRCPGCDNHNFASRSVCNSKTCSEQRPAGTSLPLPRHLQPPRRPPQNKVDTRRDNNKKPGPRHDVATSKAQSWAVQADDATLAHNQNLRQQWLDSGETGEGMSDIDKERAQTLLARDARKLQKKQAKHKSKEAAVVAAPIRFKSWAPPADAATLAQNQALRQKMKASGGGGDCGTATSLDDMNLDATDKERAQTLMARDARKKQKKVEKQAEKVAKKAAKAEEKAAAKAAKAAAIEVKVNEAPSDDGTQNKIVSSEGDEQPKQEE